MASFDAKYSLDADHIFEGKYRIIRELGSGGFGVVYLAHQISMDRPVALKILKPGVGAHAPSARERFLREVKIISKLRHPNTVTIHDYGETVHGVVYMVLEFVEGDTLKDLLKNEGAQEPMRALGITRQIARSLAEAHTHGIVHRDLKPANIMLAELEADSDFVKVLDFGVARLLGSEDADLTSAGVPEGERALIGTPRYMSPEQVRGEDLTGASDLYSLGLIFYEMLVGEPAVQGDTTMGLIGQQLSPEPLRLPSLRALPQSIQELILQATSKNISRRFQVADEFTRAIDATAMRLGEQMGRAHTSGAFFAASGQFNAISAPPGGLGRSDSSGQFANISPDSTSAATPSNLRHRRDSDSHQAARRDHQGIPVGVPASQSAELDYYESNFDPQQLSENSSPERSNANRSAAGAAAGAAAASFPLVRNEVDFDEPSGLCGIPSSELPLPRDAAGSPFGEPEPPESPQLEVEEPTPVPHSPSVGDDEESLVGFGFAVAKVCFLSTLAAGFVYLTFLIIGALVSEIVDGKIQFIVAIMVALAIPFFSALGENSQKERFDVVKRPMDRLLRVLIGTAIFSGATVFLVSFAMPGQVTDHLRNDPNWMFRPNPAVAYEPTPATHLNRQVSFVMADMIEVATVAVGRYDGQPTKAQDSTSSDAPTFTPPPAPTRPGTRQAAQGSDDEPTEGDGEEDEDVTQDRGEEVTEEEGTQEQEVRRPTPRTNDDDNDNDNDSDYVRW